MHHVSRNKATRPIKVKGKHIWLLLVIATQMIWFTQKTHKEEKEVNNGIEKEEKEEVKKVLVGRGGEGKQYN